MATHPLIAAASEAVLAIGPELDRLQALATEQQQLADRAIGERNAARVAREAAEAKLAREVAAREAITTLQNKTAAELARVRGQLDAAHLDAATLRDYFARLDRIGAVFAPVDVPTLEPRKPILEQLADAVKAGTL